MEVARKQKLGYELVCEAVFRPLAQLVVAVLAPLRVPPPAVVLANAACALAAAVALARGQLVVAALLLQLKTLLDNADGQLARATGRVTVLGRYLDSESDLLTNAAIFAALGYATGRPWLALAAFCMLTLVLSVNFNLERLDRRRGHAARRGRGDGPACSPGSTASSTRRRTGSSSASSPAASVVSAVRYVDRAMLGMLANMGLSTQLAALGVCLALGRPQAYLWLVLACGAAVVGLAVRRELTARRPGTTAAREAL